MYQVQGAQYQQVVLAVAALCDEAVERREQAVRDVPLEAFLQFEELAEGRVVGEVGEGLGFWGVGLCLGLGGWWLLARALGG